LSNVSAGIAGGVAAAVVVGAFVGATWNPPRPAIDLNALERQSSQTQRPVVDTRPLVVLFGDSVTYSMFDGLRRFGDETGGFRVGHQAKFQCGIARGGEQLLSSGIRNSETRCPVRLRKWRGVMRNYEASLAIVGSSVMDIADRRLSEWGEFKSPGDTEFDDFMLSQYEHVVDLVSASGAKVAWLNVPCMLDENIPGPLAGSPAISAERIGYLNETILPRLAQSRPAVRMIDIHTPLCRAVPENDTLRAPGVRPDGMHFSEEGSQQMARWLGPQIVAVLQGGTPPLALEIAPVR
jgi:hypothetical protein